MSEILNKVLSERPNNVIEFFEQYSRRIMEDRLRTKSHHLVKVRGLKPQYRFSAKAMEYINVRKHCCILHVITYLYIHPKPFTFPCFYNSK